MNVAIKYVALYDVSGSLLADFSSTLIYNQ